MRSEKVPGQTDNAIYTVKNLFGQLENSYQAFARSLAEKLKLQQNLTKPILISIGLKKDQIENFNLLKYYESKIIEFYRRD